MLTPAHPAELPVFGRLPVAPVRGRGCELWDADGRRYLDLYGGHAVAVAGHCHPRVVQAVQEQAERLLFYSNAVPLEPRDRLFALLARETPDQLGQAFLVNSGAEANEAALMLARRATGRARVVCCEGGFHGRSLATLAVSGIGHYRDLALAGGAGRDVVGHTAVAAFNGCDSLEALVDDRTAAVIVEPVQGMAGAREATGEFLARARRVCDERGAMLIFDEVQCGCGRTGAFTAAQAYGVTPDLLTLAKGIAGGLPMGVTLVSAQVASGVRVGDLGTTFGGGPVPCAAAAANLEVIREEGLAARALAMECVLREGLREVPGVVRVQGKGLLLGAVLDRPAKPVQAALLSRGILVGGADDPRVLRLLPPLVVCEDECNELVDNLREVLA